MSGRACDGRTPRGSRPRAGGCECAPRPGRLFTVTRPPCCSAVRRTRLRPRPAADLARSRAPGRGRTARRCGLLARVDADAAVADGDPHLSGAARRFHADRDPAAPAGVLQRVAHQVLQGALEEARGRPVRGAGPARRPWPRRRRSARSRAGRPRVRRPPPRPGPPARAAPPCRAARRTRAPVRPARAVAGPRRGPARRSAGPRRRRPTSPSARFSPATQITDSGVDSSCDTPATNSRSARARRCALCVAITVMTTPGASTTRIPELTTTLRRLIAATTSSRDPPR